MAARVTRARAYSRIIFDIAGVRERQADFTSSRRFRDITSETLPGPVPRH